MNSKNKFQFFLLLSITTICSTSNQEQDQRSVRIVSPEFGHRPLNLVDNHYNPSIRGVVSPETITPQPGGRIVRSNAIVPRNFAAEFNAEANQRPVEFNMPSILRNTRQQTFPENTPTRQRRRME